MYLKRSEIKNLVYGVGLAWVVKYWSGSTTGTDSRQWPGGVRSKRGHEKLVDEMGVFEGLITMLAVQGHFTHEPRAVTMKL